MTDAPARFILGLDLGLLTGWSVWDCDRDRRHISGVIDVRKLKDEGQRIHRWAEDLRLVLNEAGTLSAGVEAVGFEEVRHMHGQGARYILMQQGILLDWCYGHEVLCAGVNVSTLKAWARRYGTGGDKDLMGPALKNAADMLDHLARRLPVDTMAYAMTQDEAMATWVALWVREMVRDGTL